MLKILAALILSMALVDLSASTLPIDTSVVEKGIIFLWYDIPDRPPEGGTGFLIQVPLMNDASRATTFIVTARHIVDPEWEGCSWSNPSVLHARVNIKNYKDTERASGVWETTFKLARNSTWFAPDDDKADIAVIPFQSQEQLNELEKNDVASLRFADIATKEEIERFKIGTGDGIVSAGLVPALFDVKRNYPAFKFGKISNVLNEPLRSRCEATKTSPLKERWAWVVSANFVPGNSGSPVYLLPVEFSLGPPLQYNGPRPMLLGVVSSTIDGADLAEMAPIEYMVPVLQRLCPGCNFSRGEQKFGSQ
jgi:hypothetical protein